MLSYAQIRQRPVTFQSPLLKSSVVVVDLQFLFYLPLCSGAVVVGFVVGRSWFGLVIENLVFGGWVGFLWVLVCVSGSGVVLGWSVLLMDLWVLLVVDGSGFVGFVNAVALLVVDGFVGFASGRWLVVASFLWVLLSWVVGFMGSVLQFFLLLWIREREERRLKRGVRERTEDM